MMASDKYRVEIATDGWAMWTIKMALALGAAIATFGLAEVYPQSFVRVVDRHSGRVVLQHKWSSPSAAANDAASIGRQLTSLDAGEFVKEFGVRIP